MLPNEAEHDLVRSTAVVAQRAQRVVVGISDGEIVRDVVLREGTHGIGMAVHGTEPELLVEEEVGRNVETGRGPLHGLHQEGGLELVVQAHVEHVPTGKEVVRALAGFGNERERIGLEELRAQQLRRAEPDEVAIAVVHHAEAELWIHLRAHVRLENLVTGNEGIELRELALEQVQPTLEAERQLGIAHEDAVGDVRHEGVLGHGPCASRMTVPPMPSSRAARGADA